MDMDREELIDLGQKLKVVWREEFEMASRTPDADRSLMWARIAARFLDLDPDIEEHGGGAWRAQEAKLRRQGRKTLHVVS